MLQARHVYLDTEGFELGTAVGKLSIVQLGLPSALAPRAVDVFLVDVLALPAAALRGLWAVLEDASLVKVVWDGKQDFSELLHAEGVELAGVLDLQIAELLGRVRASDRLKAQGTAAVEHRAGWVWSLGGMKRAVDEFKAFAPEERDGAEKRASPRFPPLIPAAGWPPRGATLTCSPALQSSTRSAPSSTRAGRRPGSTGR